MLHVYNKHQLKHRLNLNNLYVVSTRSSGFTVEVSSNVSSQVTMVGVRVMLGLKSLEKAPSFVEIFGRTHPVLCSSVLFNSAGSDRSFSAHMLLLLCITRAFVKVRAVMLYVCCLCAQVSFPANCHRWVDIPFTRDESLQADKLIKINC